MRIVFLYSVLFLSLLYSSKVNVMIDEILSGKSQYSNDELFLKINDMNAKNSQNILILKGLIESDGEKSFNYFKDYIDSNVDKKYNELAILRISEYYYISGLYIKSSEWYKKLIMNYPDSKNLKSGINYFLNSLSVSGKLDSAKYYSKILHDRYPDLKFNEKFYSNDSKII